MLASWLLTRLYLGGGFLIVYAPTLFVVFITIIFLAGTLFSKNILLKASANTISFSLVYESAPLRQANKNYASLCRSMSTTIQQRIPSRCDSFLEQGGLEWFQISIGVCAAFPVSIGVCAAFPVSIGICAAFPVSHDVCAAFPVSIGVCAAFPVSIGVCAAFPVSIGVCAAFPVSIGVCAAFPVSIGVCAAFPVSIGVCAAFLSRNSCKGLERHFLTRVVN